MLSRTKLCLVLILMIAVAGALLRTVGWQAGGPGPFASLEGKVLAEGANTNAASGRGRLLSSTADGVTFEVKVPWEQLILEAVTSGSNQYVRVELPGWSVTAEAGAPALPFLSQAVGAPVGVDVAVRVVPSGVHTVSLTAPPLPVTTQKVEWKLQAAADGVLELPQPIWVVEEDPAVYGGDAPYPGLLAEVASDGVIREQRVVGIAAYPVQYKPAVRELTVYESLRVEVTFEGAPPALLRAPAIESPAYEALFRGELLNYETARTWRQDLPASTGSFDLAQDELRAGPDPSRRLVGTEQRSPVGRGEELASAMLGAGVGGGLPWMPPEPGWRVRVREDGLYRLTYAELEAAGLPLQGQNALDPRTLQLYHLGSEAAITVSGEDDGEFNEADYLLFYGQGISSKYSADNVYWLTYGQGTGLRMASRDGAPGTADRADHYPAQRHMEGNAYYLSLAPGDENLDRWMWDYIFRPSRPSWSHTFSLAAPYTAPATLTIAMLGYLQNEVNPDHHARILLNETPVGDVTWDGITWQIAEMAIPSGLLATGTNTVTVEAVADTGYAYDILYIDWVELDFANTFLAEDDELSFSYDTNGTTFQVDGFSTSPLAVYDVTDPAAAVRVDGVDVIESGPYSAVFEDDVTVPTDYFAMAEAAYRTVQAIEADVASDLGSTANGADHIVITHSDFSAQAQTLRDFRASQGLRAVAVDVQDIYDEFGYGIEGVASIHDFLAYAYGSWQAPAPSYVVLIGDGHYDPKNYAYTRVSYLPPYLAPVDPWIGETAADNRYVTLVGDDTLPDMMLGRLAVNDSAEASAFVDKIVAYEGSSGEWQQQVLAVADDADDGGNFAQLSDDLLACCLPQPYQAQKVHYGVTHTTVDDARTAIQDSINAGVLIVNYIGHGTRTQWADEGLFTASDVAGLANAGKLPVVLAMTCREGQYHYPHSSASYDALAEVVTRTEGKGAVASWSPTGLGVTSGHRYLDRGFFDALFLDGVDTLGGATAAGTLNLWIGGANLDLIDAYLLFGDPATTMTLANLPSACTLEGSVTLQRPGKPAPDPSWQVPLTVTVGSADYSVTTDPFGQFTILDLQAGSYDVRVKGLHTLANLKRGVTLVPGSNAIDFGTLLEGDANDNNCVNITDFSVLVNGFTPRFDARADFNEDGLVNIRDFSMLVSNFGRCGDIEIIPGPD